MLHHIKKAGKSKVKVTSEQRLLRELKVRQYKYVKKPQKHKKVKCLFIINRVKLEREVLMEMIRFHLKDKHRGKNAVFYDMLEKNLY